MTSPLPLVPLHEVHSSGGQLSSLTIINARLPYNDKNLSSKLWRIECNAGRVHQVSLHDSILVDISNEPQSCINAHGSLVLPSLCHSHVHLDKCFILDRCCVVTGQFNEALQVTGQAKAAFPLDIADLYARGARLICESVQYGVTSMRAHVEVDKIVGFSCLDVAQALKKEFQNVCEVQIAVFAQEPLFDDPADIHPGQNFSMLIKALKRNGVDVIGSAPYVEATPEQSKMNIALIMEAAHEKQAHVDFHLDYNLDSSSEPLIYEVIKQARCLGRWITARGQTTRRITIGHATRLQLFEDAEWQKLVEEIKDLPITFVGLPQSDLYMQGREDFEKPLGPPRSTLRVPHLLNKYGIEVAMSVNNIQNAFTPQGSLDPLSLCSLGVTLFQTAAVADIETLVRSVSLTSKIAVGGDGSRGKRLFPALGDPADFVILHGTSSIQSAVLHPPFDRTTIYAGVVVASKRSETWLLKTTLDIPQEINAGR